jgi:chromosome segregation ATPase
VKELNLHIEKLSKEVAGAKRSLADEVTETQSKQIQLDKTAEDFRRLHQERQDLVRQWDEAMDAMRRRDEMIQVKHPPSNYRFFPTHLFLLLLRTC